jgi:phosphatidylinositol-3-phosphatase
MLSPTPGATGTASANAGGVPAFDHVYLIVMENREYGSIVGNADAPYLNSLVARYGLATNYDAVGHPSQPNYIALFAGSTLGVTTDGHYDLAANNVADQVDAAGKSWHVYEQDYPGQCSPAASAYGGVDLIGLAGYYFRKHNPAVSFTDISGQPTRCAAITSLSSFSPLEANFELIVPNTYNDMHSASTATGDAFLNSFVPLITSSPAFADSLLVITWDEGSSDIGGGGQVATLVISPLLASLGMQSSVAHNHYSLLRTIEDGLGLPCLSNSCQATGMSEFFR